jgi:hypothetical protein
MVLLKIPVRLALKFFVQHFAAHDVVNQTSMEYDQRLDILGTALTLRNRTQHAPYIDVYDR